jgi:hypothetical protein
MGSLFSGLGARIQSGIARDTGGGRSTGGTK